jgi:hypothetical protein
MPLAVAPAHDNLHHAEIPLYYQPAADRVPLIRSVDSSDEVQPPLYEAEKIVNHT